jgi:hypothetical protein
MNNLSEIQFSAITVMGEMAQQQAAAEIPTSGLSGTIPRLYGRVMTKGNIFWVKNNAIDSLTFNDTEFKYATFALGLGIGPAHACTRIWCGNKRIYNILTDPADANGFGTGCYTGKAEFWANGHGYQKFDFQFFPGTKTQLASKVISDADGEEITPRFPSLCYVVFINFPLKPFGNSLEGLDLRLELSKYSEFDRGV